MKHRIGTKALSMLLALIMVLGMVPATAISAFADGVPETLVTSLTELYSGDETRAREDLEALSAAGLLGDDGKLVDLDIREDGGRVELAALSERIMSGESVGEITVNGHDATTEQIVQISQVKAAIEIAELLDEEIDVTDEHVENLESLLTGIQDGSVDLEGALQTGALSLNSTNNVLLGAGSEITQYATTRWNDLPSELTLTDDGKSFIGSYISGSTYEPNHAFPFESGSAQYVNGATGASAKTDDVVAESNTRRNMFDWDKAIVGVDDKDRLHPIVTVVLPLIDDDAVQNLIASDADEGKLLDITENGVGLTMDLPGYGEVTMRYVFRYMYFTTGDWDTHWNGQHLQGQDPRFPVYLVETEVDGGTKVTAVAARFTAPANMGTQVRQDALTLCVNPRGSAIDDEWIRGDEGDGGDEFRRKGHRFFPENWSDFLIDANGLRYYSTYEIYVAEEKRLYDIQYALLCHLGEVDFLDYGAAYTEFSAAEAEWTNYRNERNVALASPIVGRCLPYYIAPAFLISGDKFIERPEGSWEQAEGGFIKLTNPENRYFPYVYPKDTQNPQNQYDVELMYTEDFYQVYIQGFTRLGDDVDLRAAIRISDRLDFSFPEGTFSWSNWDIQKIVSDDGLICTAIPSRVTTAASFTLFVYPYGQNSSEKSFYLSPKNFQVKDAEPFLLIPKSSRIRDTMMLLDTDIQFSSNATQHNKIDTVFKAELYRIREDQIDINAASIPEDAVKIEVPGWGDFPSPARDPVTQYEYNVTHITVPGTAMDQAGTYAFKISAEFNDGETTQTLSSIAFLKAKQIPATIKIGELESTYADKVNVPSITYSLENAVENAEVKYTIQQAGSSAITEYAGSASGGTISIPEVSFEGLKTAYTITVYARNSEEDPWSVDSVLITVYNNDILDILIKDVAFGEFGGTTGGVKGNGTEIASGTTVDLDNKAKIEELLEQSGEGAGFAITFDDLLSLRSDVGLMRVVSANYGDGTWGAISDRMKWTYTDADGKTSDTVTLNNKENGAYADLHSHSHTSYVPSTDFLIVATDVVSEDAPVTITATHANSGITRSFQVTVKTLRDKLYMFCFLPKATTYVSYTNGDGVQRVLHSNANGELAVYEPSGIASDIITMSEFEGETYAGTYFKKDLVSGERNLVKADLYPCNNLKLLPISSQTVTFLKPDGKPYSGKVTIRAGVYKGGVYCPDIGVRATEDEGDPILREDVILNADDGNVTLYYDPTQLTADNGLTRGLKYVYEYRIDGYQPGYVVVNPTSSDPADFIVNLQNIRGGATTPQITRQEYQQYLNGNTPTSYVRNVIDSTDNIGISPNFPKAVLYTDIALPGEAVGTDANGYSTYEGADVVKFAFYTTGDKKLTGQTDLSGDSVKATQITNLSQLNNATYFVFPFSTVPMLRSTYTMTNADMKADGIDDAAKTPTARIKAVFKRGDLTVGNINMPFRVTNVSNQPNLNSAQGATAVGKEVRENLRETTDIGAIFRSINVNDMIKKGFVFLGNLAGAGGNNLINLMILPTQDPATFRIIAFVGQNQRSNGGDDGVSVNFNAQDLAEDMNKFQKEMEELSKKKDDENDSGGEGSMEFNFYGTIILEAHAGVADGKWSIAFRGGNVGTNVKGKYEWGQTFFCGPYPAFISFEVGFHADLEVAFGNKGAARAMLLDAALGVSVEAFAGLGFDLSIVAIQLGIYGEIGADVNFLLLTPSNAKASTGTKLTISGEVGIKLKVKILFISYSKKFASTGFNWTKKWNNYDQIKQYWNNQGFATLMGTTRSGRAYTMYLFDDGSTIVEIEGGAELENRDYLELAERSWNSGSTGGRRLMKAAGPITNALTNVQTNAYPYSHPAFTDDGEIFLYISDNDNAKKVESVTSFAVKNGGGYENTGRVDTSEDNVLADLDVVASGTKNNAFAAWVKQVETPKMEKDAEVTNDELGMMFNATEIYAASYNGTEWMTTQLTDNNVADMSPTVASSGNNAIIAWRSMNASSMPKETSAFDGTVINVDFQDGKVPAGWSINGEGNLNSENDNKYLRLGSNGTSVYLPAIDMSKLSNPRLSFKYRGDYGDDYGWISKGQLTAQYSEDGSTWTDISGATALTSPDWSSDWREVSVALPAKNIQIRFCAGQAADNFSPVYIDDVSLTADPITEDQIGVQDITAMFDVENNINYSTYNGTAWTTAQVAYNGSAGTVNAIDSAMLSDGTAILVYTVRTGDDVTSTETFYTVIDTDGNAVTTGRLTNDSYTDTNAQVTAVNDPNGGYFVLGWYSEHDAGEGSTVEYDDEGNATKKAVVAHDIRLARINANGSYDIDFPESIGGTGEAGISSDFHFSAPANNTDLTNVSVVWSQRKDSDAAEDAGKYELNAVRFFKADDVTGFTAPTLIAETSKNYTVDRFDAYTDDTGAVHAIILGSDYSTIEGISVYDSIDLDAAAGNTVTSNSDSPNNLDILDGEAISSLKLATGTFPEIAADVTADINISEVIPGLTTPVLFTVTNTGTGTLNTVTATVGGQSKEFTGLNLLPNESATLVMSYNVPEGAVSDPAYTVSGNGTELGSGTLTLNRPDVGISGMKILREENGERDIQVRLANSSDIPLAGSGKTVKLAFYQDPFHENMIGEEITVSAADYADIDKGIFTTVQTIDVTGLYSGDEIPEEGLTVYAHAWVDETEEPDVYNNDSFISFSGLLVRNNGEKLTTDTALEVNDGTYTVYADIRNNSMQEVNAGIPVAVLLDSNGNIIAKKNFRDTELVMGKESRYNDLSVSFTADEIEGTPVEADVRRVIKVSFDVNGGTGEFADVTTDLNGHITLPESTPTPPESDQPVFFRGWYTAPTGGELITEETFFNVKTTVYAQYTTHQHVFEYTISDSGDTIIAKCVSTVNDDCPLEDQDRTATLTINVPERAATGYGMPDATVTGSKEVLGTPTVYYYTANEACTAKVGDALSRAPLNAGKYWAEFTLVDGEKRITAHVVYEIPEIEGLSFSEVEIPEYIRITDPAQLDGITMGDSVAALAWIYANQDSLRSDDPRDEIPKYIVYGKQYVTRPDYVPEEYWQYDDNTEYAFCYRFTTYDCEPQTISVNELKDLLSNGNAEVYIPGTDSIQAQTDASFNTVSTQEELSSSMNPCTELDALLWILANREEHPNGIIMLSQRDEYGYSSYSFIRFTPESAMIQNGDLNYVFDMHQREGLPIFVANSSDVLNPNLSYTVAYELNGGNGNLPGGGRYYVKSKIEIPAGDGIYNPNLVFDGWNTREDGTGDAYKPGDKFEVLGNTTFYAQWKHVHNWTLTYNEGTHVYTATCDVPGCPNSTLTLHPEAVDKVYDGENAQPYVCSEEWTEENGLPIPTVTFYRGGEQVSEAKNVGTYTALVLLDGHENSVDEFSITPRPVVITADDQEKHEGQEDPELTVSYDGVGANLYFVNDTTYPWQVVTEGDRVYAKSGNGDRDRTTSTLKLDVKLEEAGTLSFDYKYGTEGWCDWCYFYVDGSEKLKVSDTADWQTYSCELSAGSHTLTWSYTKDGSTSENGDFFAVDNIVIATEGGVTQEDPEEGSDDTVFFDCLIADLRFANDVSYPWTEVTEDDRVYAKAGNTGRDDTASTLKLDITLAEAGTLSFDYKYGSEESFDKCYFKVDGNEWLNVSGSGNWRTFSRELSAGSHSLIWSYTKDGSSADNGDFFAVDNIVIATEGAVTQEDPNLVLIRALNKSEGGIVEGETLNYTISREEGEAEGTYTITVTMGENPNYDVKETRNGTFTILESLGEPQTIEASDVTATYGDTGVKINASLTVGDGTLSYEVKSGDAVTVDDSGNLTIVKAGSAVVTVTASKTETYAPATKSVNVTINPKAMTVSAENVTATVNGQPHGITVTVTDPAEGYTVKYGTAVGTYNLTTSPTLTEAGTLTVYYQVTADNYVTTTGSAVLTLVNHAHEFSYTVGTGEDANTITATCSNDDCPLPNHTATLTISAPKGEIVYDGAAHPAVITDANGIQGDAKVLYVANGAGEAVATEPVNAGTYQASITLGEGEGAKTASVKYEIKKAALTNVSVAQNGTLTYNGDAQTPEVTTAANAVKNQTVTFTYSKSQDGEYGAMPTFTNVADAGTVYYKASAPNHSDVTGSFTVTMNKASQTAPAAPTADTATANTIRLTEVEGCEYSMDGTTWQDSATFTGLAKNTQYTFYQRLKETANYNASPASAAAQFSTTNHNHDWGSFTANGATISATCGNSDGGHSGELSATMTITAPALKVYGGTGDAEATVENGIEGVEYTVVYKQGKTVLDAAPTAAGTYTASITLAAADIGQESDVTASVTYTIDKATPATPTGVTATRTATSFTVTNPVQTEPAKYEYSINNGGTWQDSAEFTNLTPDTTYHVVVREKETANYNPSSASEALAVTTLPVITMTGTARYGRTLTATSGNYGYQWYRVDGKSETLISNATQDTYKINAAADIGKVLRVKVTVGEDVIAVDSAVVEVGLYATPVLSVSKTTVTSDTIKIEGFENYREDGKYQYSIDGGVWKDISSIPFTISDLTGNTTYSIVVQGKEVKSGNVTVIEAGTPSAPLTLKTPAKTVALTGVSINGTAQVGGTLTAAITGANNETPTGVTYQWYHVNGSDTPISGATGAAYTLTSADFGKTIKVVATGVNGSGGVATVDATTDHTVAAIPAADLTGKTISTTATQTSITVLGFGNTSTRHYEYACVAGENAEAPTEASAWQSGTEFTGLTVNTDYTVFVRTGGTATDTAWQATGTAIKANAKTLANPLPFTGAAPTVSMDGYTYGGTASTPTVNGTLADGASSTYEFRRLGAAAWTQGAPDNALDIGTYEIHAKITADGHSDYTTATTNFTVSQAALTAPTISADGVTVTVSDNIPASKKVQYVIVAASDAAPNANSTAWKSATLDSENKFELTGLKESYDYDVYVRSVPAPTESNYTLSAWSAKATGTTPTTKTVVYDLNGGKVKSGKTFALTATFTEDSYTLADGSAIERPGYSFAGWKLNDTRDTFTSASSGGTYFAQWTAKTYTVTFAANGGTGDDKTQSGFTYGTSKKLDNNTFTYDGHVFAGWATTATGAVRYGDGQTVMNLTTGESVTLYAVWGSATNVTGTITSAEGGVTEVTLKRGDIQIGETQIAALAYDSSKQYTGSYTFKSIPDGIYNIVAVQNVERLDQDGNAFTEALTVTSAINIVNGSITTGNANFTMPESDYSSIVSVAGTDTPPVVVGGLDEEAKQNALDDRSVTITMTVEKQEETTADVETKDAIEAIASTANAPTEERDYLNIDVKKEITKNGQSESEEAVTQTDNLIDISIPYDLSGKTDAQICLYRFHEGEATKLGTSNDSDSYYTLDRTHNLIVLHTKLFSTYAIGYNPDASEPTPGSNGSAGGGGTQVYAIETSETTNGTVETSVKSSASGKTVTITATPDAGYAVDTVTVTDASGKSVSVTKVNDTTYTFTQPSGKVTVNVTFKEIDKTSADVFDSYTDLDKSGWYREGVKYAPENGIMSGYGGGLFGPNDTTSRAMMAQILWNMEGNPTVNYAMSYNDVVSGAWYAEAVRWATSEKIMSGYGGGKFGPNDNMTREQLVTIMYRYAQLKKVDVSIGEDTNILSYDDAFDVSEWAIPAMQWAVGAEIVNGTSASTLSPKNNASRAEIATIVMRYCTKAAK